ncbi:hypothetical protein QUA79_11070 [Microcoleus sp. F8-D1]
MSISHRGCLIPLGCRWSGTALIAANKFVTNTGALLMVKRDRPLPDRPFSYIISGHN